MIEWCPAPLTTPFCFRIGFALAFSNGPSGESAIPYATPSRFLTSNGPVKPIVTNAFSVSQHTGVPDLITGRSHPRRHLAKVAGMRLFEGTKWDWPPRCERCGELEEDCTCPPPRNRARFAVEKRKKGKGVTLVRGLPADQSDVPAFC